MRHHLTKWTALGALALLAACGSDDRPSSARAVIGGQVLARLNGDAGRPKDAREILTPQVVATSPTSLILVVVERTDRGLTLFPVAVNRGTEDWRDANGGGLLRRGGILVGTRGLGFDLLTADVAPLRAALSAGGGSGVVRVNRYIDGDNQVIARRFECDVRRTGTQRLDFYGTAHATTVYAETCTGDGPDFENRYWVEGDGTVRRALEQVSPEIGPLAINLLKP